MLGKNQRIEIVGAGFTNHAGEKPTVKLNPPPQVFRIHIVGAGFTNHAEEKPTH